MIALPWLQIGAAAAIVAALLWWRHDSVQDALRERDEAVKAAHDQRRAEIAEYVVSMSDRTTRLIMEHRAERGRIQTHTETVIRKVPTYVTAKADAGCVVTRGFVELHDDAATGRVSALPDAAGGLVDQPSGVSLSTAGTAVSRNYGACKEFAAEVAKWRAWYPAEAKAHKAFAGTTAAKPDQPSQQPKGK